MIYIYIYKNSKEKLNQWSSYDISSLHSKYKKKKNMIFFSLKHFLNKYIHLCLCIYVYVITKKMTFYESQTLEISIKNLRKKVISTVKMTVERCR